MRFPIILLALVLSGPLLAGPEAYRGGRKIESFNNPSFNSMGNASAAWIDGQTVPGWYSSQTSITYGWAGAVSGARMYGYRFDASGNSSAVAGALGSKTTAASGPIHFAKALVNESGHPIDRFSISYQAFVANSEIDPDRADRLSFSHKVGGGFAGEGYVEVAALEYAAAPGNARGNPVAGTVQRKSATVEGILWAPGETLWLRWTDHHDETAGGVGMGIDHLHFSTPVPRAQFYYEWDFDESGEIVVYHIDNRHPDASDANPGTLEQPLRTLQRGVELADSDTRAGKGSHLIVHPGVYREIVDITERPGNRSLTIEALEPGTVTLSGSDVFSDWEPVPGMENVYRHAWPYAFGWEPNPWPGDLALRYLQGTRRELLFINKYPMTQVVSAAELAEMTYLVDEDNAQILLYPPTGIDPNTSLTEVSVRPQALYGDFSKMIRVFRVNNVRLRGLRIEHAAAASLANDSAVAFRGSSNIVIEHLDIVYNNGFGLSISSQGDTPVENVVVRRTRTNHNGAIGFDGGGVHNALYEDGEASYNNWRGALWGATGWAPCGFKLASYHGLVMRDYRIQQNHASGGWLDTDNSSVLLERVVSVNNYRAGMSLEANHGPILVRDCVFYGNTTGINGFDNSGVRIEGSWIFDNSTGQVRMAGSTNLTPEELAQYEEGWSRDRQARRHIPRDWHIEDSFIGMTGSAGSPYFYGLDVRGGGFLDGDGLPRYRDFPDTFTSTGNLYAHPSGTGYTGWPNLVGGSVDYPQWLGIFKVTEPNTFISAQDALALREQAVAATGIALTGFTGAVPTAPVVTVEVLEPWAWEAGQVPAVFRINRSEGDAAQPLQVTFRLSGTATAGVDYPDPGDRVRIEAGEDHALVTITPVADGQPELVETVILEIEPDLDGLYRLGMPRTGTVRIVDQDSVEPAEVQASLAASAPAVTRVVQLHNPLAQPLTVTLGDLGSDYRWVDSSELDGPDYEWTDISTDGSTVLFNWVTTNRDGISSAIPLGFAFPFYGQNFSSVHVHSNGFVTFTPLENPSSSYGSHVVLPGSGTQPTANMIAGFWTNLQMDLDSRVSTRAGADRSIVQYKDMIRAGVFGAPQRVSFQIVLHASGAIDLLYHHNSFTADVHTIGLQGPTPERGLTISHNDAFARQQRAVRIESPAVWMSAPREPLVLPAGGSATLDIRFHPDQVAPGSYTTWLVWNDPDTGAPLFILPVRIAVGDLLLDGTRSGDWIHSDWFGWFHDSGTPWIYVPRAGWVYLHRSASTDLWYWQPQTGWLWTHWKLFPWQWNPTLSQWINR